MRFLETSAFNGENIDKAFDIMVKEIYQKFSSDTGGDDQLDSNAKAEDIKLDKDKADVKNKKKCC